MVRELLKLKLRKVSGEDIPRVEPNMKELVIIDPETDKPVFLVSKEFKLGKDGKRKYGYCVYYLGIEQGKDVKKFITKLIDRDLRTALNKFHIGITEKAVIVQFLHQKMGWCMKTMYKAPVVKKEEVTNPSSK